MTLEDINLCGVIYTYYGENKKRERTQSVDLFSSKFFYIDIGGDYYYPSQLNMVCVDQYVLDEDCWREEPLEHYHDIHTCSYITLSDCCDNDIDEDFDPSKFTVKYGYVCWGEPDCDYEVGVIVSIEYNGVEIFHADMMKERD